MSVAHCGKQIKLLWLGWREQEEGRRGRGRTHGEGGAAARALPQAPRHPAQRQQVQGLCQERAAQLQHRRHVHRAGRAATVRHLPASQAG